MRERKRILIVDNSDKELGTLRGILGRAGCDTVGTWSGMEALNLLQSKDFDVLLVDEYLADLYVGDFLKRVSRLPIRPRVVVMRGGPTQIGKSGDLVPIASSVVDKRQADQLCNEIKAHFAGRQRCKVGRRLAH